MLRGSSDAGVAVAATCPMVWWQTVRVRVLVQRLWQRAPGTDVVADATQQMLRLPWRSAVRRDAKRCSARR